MNLGRTFLWQCLFFVSALGQIDAFAADDDIVLDGKTLEWHDPARTRFVQFDPRNQNLNVQARDALIVRARAIQLNQVILNQNKLLNQAADVKKIEVQLQQFDQFRAIDRDNFGLDATEQQERWKINSEIDRKINEIDRACQLTDAQRKKLEMVGKADRKRFFDRFSDLREQSRADERRIPEVQRELQALQRKASVGILDGESFFAKSIHNVLTSEQREKISGHRREKLRKTILLTIGDVEKIVPLNDSQREAIAQILLDQLTLPSEFSDTELLVGNSERLLMLYELSLLSEEKIKPLLDDKQWQELQPRLQEFQRFEAHLKQRGLITESHNRRNKVPTAK